MSNSVTLHHVKRIQVFHDTRDDYVFKRFLVTLADDTKFAIDMFCETVIEMEATNDRFGA